MLTNNNRKKTNQFVVKIILLNKIGVSNYFIFMKHNSDTMFSYFNFRYMFIEYSNPTSAADAVKNTNGYKLDKAHTFAVNLFSDYDK